MVKHRIFVVFPWVVSKCSYILNSELLETKQNSVEMGLPAEMCPEPWSLVAVHRGGLQVYMKNKNASTSLEKPLEVKKPCVYVHLLRFHCAVYVDIFVINFGRLLKMPARGVLMPQP